MFLTATPERYAVVTQIEAGGILGVTRLPSKRGIQITIGIHFVGGQLPSTFNEGSTLRAA
jgi:hypothetical protein